MCVLGRQFAWLDKDLEGVDRSVTPWVIVGSHCPWYNSNRAHHLESQAVSMQKAMEPLFEKHGVDLALAGHVHAYERECPHQHQCKHRPKQSIILASGLDVSASWVRPSGAGSLAEADWARDSSRNTPCLRRVWSAFPPGRLLARLT